MRSSPPSPRSSYSQSAAPTSGAGARRRGCAAVGVPTALPPRAAVAGGKRGRSRGCGRRSPASPLPPDATTAPAPAPATANAGSGNWWAGTGAGRGPLCGSHPTRAEQTTSGQKLASSCRWAIRVAAPSGLGRLTGQMPASPGWTQPARPDSLCHVLPASISGGDRRSLGRQYKVSCEHAEQRSWRAGLHGRWRTGLPCCGGVGGLDESRDPRNLPGGGRGEGGRRGEGRKTMLRVSSLASHRIAVMMSTVPRPLCESHPTRTFPKEARSARCGQRRGWGEHGLAAVRRVPRGGQEQGRDGAHSGAELRGRRLTTGAQRCGATCAGPGVRCG